MREKQIPFNMPSMVGNELKYIKQAVLSRKISGDGDFTKKCSRFIEDRYKAKKVLLTTSCSTALDISAILLDIKPGDEVVLPSFTFPSTANSFLIRGAILRFVDIRPDTLNIDESKIEEAINSNTRAIVVVHYAGVPCEMDAIVKVAEKYSLKIIEDSAHGMESCYGNRYLGTIGDIGCYSFHETKNVICGEGGAILVNNESLIERAEILREKGTNRSKFFRGEIDKYTWVDIGSSFLPSEVTSAFLYAQLENIDMICTKRNRMWGYYYKSLENLEIKGYIKRPASIDNKNTHNGHIFYILLENSNLRKQLLDYLKSRGILAVYHYLPLHLSPMGIKMGYRKGQLPVTEDISERLTRLPLYYSLSNREQERVIKGLESFFKGVAC